MKIHDFQLYKQQDKKISMITCYDYPSACLISESKIDCVLVGDSLAMVVHGHENTMTATMEMMVLHTKAVACGLKQQFLISDLPFLSYRISREQTFSNVQKLMQAGAHAVKLEGGDIDACDTVKSLVNSGVAVMGHIGLTPQSVHQLGGYRIQGKDELQAENLLLQAKQLEQAGCFAIVLECVPKALAKVITNTLNIPTIGIGAGMETSGQVLVWHDLLGLQTQLKPKFVKNYICANEVLLPALNAYVHEVQTAVFPTLENSF